MKTIASTALPAHVQQPRYDREQLRSRIVHFGFGAFHRAHQALLTNRVLNAKGGDWGICEISLFSGDVLMGLPGRRIICLPCWRKVPKAISPLLSVR